MNRTLFALLIIIFTAGCGNKISNGRRIQLARAGDAILYLDEVPPMIQPGIPAADSTAIVQNYINKWARKELMFQKAEK